MNLSKKKKLLFVPGAEMDIADFYQQSADVQPENLIIIQSYGAAISPFGDIMRDLIIAVYQEDVDEIFVAVTKAERKKSPQILNMIYENQGLQQKIQTMDYLFKNCIPEFPKGNICHWLAGNSGDSRSCLDIIRQHPLLPSHVRVTELRLEQENGILC